MHNDTLKAPQVTYRQLTASSPVLEMLASVLLANPKLRLIDSRFRATDRNLTIRLRNHENNRP